MFYIKRQRSSKDIMVMHIYAPNTDFNSIKLLKIKEWDRSSITEIEINTFLLDQTDNKNR